MVCYFSILVELHDELLLSSTRTDLSVDNIFAGNDFCVILLVLAKSPKKI